MAEFKKVDGRNIGDIRIFTLSTCGWCKKTKEFLHERAIAYAYTDLDLLPPDEMEQVIEEQCRYNPSGSFPTIVINGKQTIVGFDEDKLEQLIGE